MNCNTCEHWEKKEGIDAGRCLADIPNATLVPTQGQLGGQSLAVVTYWPETRPTDRCGKYIFQPGKHNEAPSTLQLV